jgi:hypothetical protein
VSRRERPRRFGEHPRRAGHRLDAARDDEIGLADGNDSACVTDGLEARSAEPIDRGAGDRHRKAGEQHRHPGHVAVVLARAVRAAEVHLLDRGRIERWVTVEEALQRGRGQVVRSHTRQRAAELADGRAHRVEDEGVGHQTLLSGRVPS